MKKTIYEQPYRLMVSELRQARQRAGLTQTDAGEKIGRSRQWIHKVETCELRLDVMQTAQLCRVYGESFSALMLEIGNSDDTTKP